MKIYRVVPDSFATGDRLNAHEKVSPEDIYYRMGYTPFSGKMVRNKANTLNAQNKQGKYFYLFAEDAIQVSYILMHNFHELKADTFSLIEYDVPEDIIVKNIGFGNYTQDIFPIFCMETFIEKSDFGNHVIHSDQIDESTKLKYLLETFKDSLERTQAYGACASSDNEFYMDYFGVNSLSDLTDEEMIQNALLNSEFYRTFSTQPRELISSPYITGKIAPVNKRFILKKLRDHDKYIEYYQNFGVKCNFSEEHKKYKEELSSQIGSENQDKEKIKELLKEKEYI